MINVQNLKFYDKFGDSYNLSYNDQGGFWEGKEWIKPLSVALFDNSNIFVLEGDSASPTDNPTFPRLGAGETITFSWTDNKNSDVFFLYDIATDSDSGDKFLNRLQNSTFSHSDYQVFNDDYPRPIQRMKLKITGSSYVLTWMGMPNVIYAYSLFPGLYQVSIPILEGNTGIGAQSLDISGFMATQTQPLYTISLTTTYINGGTAIATVVFDRAVDGTYVSQSQTEYVNPLTFAVPLQVNVAFNPIAEVGYTRTLNAYYNTMSGSQKIMQLDFYGEGEGEDERFKIWLGNFGIKFSREDALLLKDYDLTEGLPDYSQINQKRKELLVNKEQIFPYVGTYKALINFVDIMGYKDVLRVKEYWKNTNPTSEYYNKLALVDITDVIDTGTVDSLNLIDFNRQIKYTNQFKKTNLLALVYEIDVLSGDYDDSGIPIVTRTTDFKIDEIFYKLNGLGKKIKKEFLPINVQIKDVIGEFLYFEKLTFRFWYDRVDIREAEINRTYNINLSIPSSDVINLQMLDIKSLYKTGASGFPVVSFNESNIDPFDNDQLYDPTEIPDFVDSIEDFYSKRNEILYSKPGERPEWEFSDEPDAKIGCPIILSLDIEDLTIFDLRGTTISDLGVNRITASGVKFANIYEIEWIITQGIKYNFSYRGTIQNLNTIPHILPLIGNYTIECKLYDLFGGISRRFKHITVEAIKPSIIGLIRMEDKFNYRIQNLSNITIEDLIGSYGFYPRTTVLDNDRSVEKQQIDLDPAFLEWVTYSVKYGIGINQFDIQIEDDSGNFVNYFASDTEEKKWWGTAMNTSVLKISDLIDTTVEDMFHTRICDLAWHGDFQNGFYVPIADASPGILLTIGNYQSYLIRNYSTQDELLTHLNSSFSPGIRDFYWSIVGDTLHAQGRIISKQLHNTWSTARNIVTATPVFINEIAITSSVVIVSVAQRIAIFRDYINLAFDVDNFDQNLEAFTVEITNNTTIPIDHIILTLPIDDISNKHQLNLRIINLEDLPFGDHTVEILLGDSRGGSNSVTSSVNFTLVA